MGPGSKNPSTRLKGSTKNALKISKNAKFERDLLKTNKRMAPQSRQIFMTFAFCVQANGQPLPRLGWVPHVHMRWVRLNGGHKTPILRPM